MAKKKVKIGTRGSLLALWQAKYIAAALEEHGFETNIVKIETKGDKILTKTIAKIGSKGVFTQEIEEQLRQKKIDIAIHSAKDMQSTIDDDLELLAFTKRERVNDVVISFNKDLRTTSSQKWLLGTSSVRRVSMIRHFYSGMQTVSIRGNLQTRMKKLEEGHCDALILAYAGVVRMGFEKYIVEHLPADTFTPATGQGTIVVQTAKKLDKNLKKKIRQITNDKNTEVCVFAERAYLKKMGGGCSLPVFALAELLPDGTTIRLNAGLVSTDGKQIIRKIDTAPVKNAKKLGQKVAEAVLKSGGKAILSKIKH